MCKRVLKIHFPICVMVLAVAYAAVAAPIFSAIAIEYQENGRFIGAVGKAYVTGESIDIVAFTELGGRIVPSPYVYSIIEKKSVGDGVFHVKCRNQVNVMVTGTIDLRDRMQPRIFLKTERGIVMTNITAEGKSMKEKHIPKMDLGR